MGIPEKIWIDLVNETLHLRGPSVYDEHRNEYVSPWNTQRFGAIRNMMAVAGAWFNLHKFTSEADMAAKVITDCSRKFKKSNTGSELTDCSECIPERAEMLSAYRELKSRWPHEFADGFDSLRLT